MYDYETLDLRLLKSWVGAYKMAEIDEFKTISVEWWKEAEQLKRALFTSRDPDNQTILDKLWESVVI